MLLLLSVGAMATPPEIVKMNFKNGSDQVDPNLRYLVITWDQPMAGSYSVAGGGPRYPEVTGKYRWKSRKVFVMPVKLYPDYNYAFWLNSPSYKNFKNKKGESAKPTKVVFKTRKAKVGERVNKLPGVPKVVSIVPRPGQHNVDPNLKEIVIKFDQPMSRGRSFTGSGETLPPANGKAYWRDKKTFVRPVKLEANHKYYFGVNSPSHRNFQSIYGKPVAWKKVNFKTRGFHEKEKQLHAIAIGSMAIIEPAEEKAAWDKLADLLETRYSYRDRQGVPWRYMCDSMASMNDEPRAKDLMVADMRWVLSHARDAHLTLVVDGKRKGTSWSFYQGNSNRRVVLSQLSGYQAFGKRIGAGKTSEGFGYVHVDSLSGNLVMEAKSFYKAVESVKDTRGLILDLRRNSGGDEGYARQIAGCFIEGTKAYAKNVSVDPEAEGGFRDVHTRRFSQNDVGPAYRGKVVVLMGDCCMSSCEALLLMMKQVPNCKLVGARSRGSSGCPVRHEVMKGIEVVLPSWKAMTMDGECFEGVGIEPDVFVEAKSDEFKKADPVFEVGVKELMK